MLQYYFAMFGCFLVKNVKIQNFRGNIFSKVALEAQFGFLAVFVSLAYRIEIVCFMWC